MANQLNYSNKLESTLNVRPERIHSSDLELIQIGKKPSWFGTDEKDYVEIWIYDTNGTIVNQLFLRAFDESLSTTTVIDNTGAYEYINIDLGKCVRDMVLDQGRYVIVFNFFRSEVGDVETLPFYIDAISPDRTEARIKLIDEALSDELYEWVVPSVSKIEAKALMDSVFGKTSDDSNIITSAEIQKSISTDSVNRMTNINELSDFNAMVSTMLPDIYNNALELMANDTSNKNVQDKDFDSYIKIATLNLIEQYKKSNQFDIRLNII